MEEFEFKGIRSMKKLYIILGVLVISFTSFGQKILYQNKPIDSILIQSTLGKTKFSKVGQSYRKKQDEYIISFDDKSEKYGLEIYRRTKLKGRYRKNEEWTEAEREKIIYRNKNIDNELVLNLIEELSVKYRKVSYSDMNLSLEKFRKLTRKSKVKKVAKKNDLKWKLNRATDKMNEFFFEKIKDTVQFNKFLIELSKKEDTYVITDAIDKIKIEIVTTNNSYVFEGYNYYPYRQPWFLIEGNKNKPVFNFRINQFLIKLLPKRFLLTSSIKESALLNGYIKWALDEKKINQ